MLEVLVVGAGFAGLSLAAALANRGFRVGCYDTNPAVVSALAAGRMPFHEPGVQGILDRHLGRELVFSHGLPEVLPAVVVICVNTDFERATGVTRLSNLETAMAAVAQRIGPGTLVVIRSTVPVGTSRRLAARLADRQPVPLLAFCPERTIQGRALEEIATLPQVIGGLNERSLELADLLFARFGVLCVRVSSLEAAELVKLANNAHTDLIYGFGNEIALISEALGLDALEVIRAANVDYPRPDLCRPGFVGGGCLSKDPYLLIESAARRGHSPTMVMAARALNEDLPRRVAGRILDTLRELGKAPPECRVLIAGFAYKGRPATDDMRGSPAPPVVAALRGSVGSLVGHDFLVSSEQLRVCGVAATSLEEGFAGADAVVFLNDHPGYAACDLSALAARMRHPGLIYDSWSLFRDRAAALGEQIRYLGLGHG